MKKTITAILALMLIFATAACGSKSASSSPVNDMKLTEIIDGIYEKHDPQISLQTTDVDISDADALKSFTGLDSSDGISEVVASEPMMSAQAYSIVLIRINDPSKASDIAKAVKEGVNPAKWVCVLADDVQVVAAGNVVMLVMMDSGFSDVVTSAQIVDAFTAIAGELSVK